MNIRFSISLLTLILIFKQSFSQQVTIEKVIEGGINAISISDDGTVLISGGNDGKTYLWNTKNLEKLSGALKHNDRVSAVSISGNHKFYVSGSVDTKIRVFDLEQNMPTRILSEHTTPINALSINPINDFFASSAKDNTIKIWDNSKSKNSINTLSGHQKEITSLLYRPDGKILCSGSLDNTIKFWDASSGELKSTLEAGVKGVKAMCYSYDEKYLAAGGNNGLVIILDGESGKKIKELEGFKSEINALSISGDDQYLAACGKDKKIVVWNMQTGKIHKEFKAHENEVTGVCFGSGGDFLISCSVDGSLKKWDVKELQIGNKKSFTSQEQTQLYCSNASINDQNGNGIIESNEKAAITFEISNQGKTPAFNLTAKIALETPNTQIKFEKEFLIGNIDAQKKQTVKIPLTIGSDLVAGNNTFNIILQDAGNNQIDPVKFNFQTSGMNSYSYIMITGQSFSSATGKAEIGAPITAKIKIKNITKNEAKNIKVNFLLPENVFAVNKLSESITNMQPAEEREIQLEFYADKNFKSSEIKIGIDMQGVAFTNAKDILLRIKTNEPLPLNEDYSKDAMAQANQIEELAKEETPLMRGGGDPLKGLNVKVSKELVIGNYYALIIGIDKYKGAWTPLANAVNDAKVLEQTLRNKYKFDKFKTLYNESATREAIIKELEFLANNVKENDNVLIYYSGHGEFKKELNKGFWVPCDADNSSTARYISNSDLQTYINGIKSKHTLLISDACFSGDIFRGNTITTPFEESERYYKEVHSLPSRQAITSGGLEPVMDGGKNGHSVFSYYLLRALEGNQSRYFDASQLYNKIKIPVINNSEQTPKFSPIKNAGDEGGQFLFIKK